MTAAGEFTQEAQFAENIAVAGFLSDDDETCDQSDRQSGEAAETNGAPGLYVKCHLVHRQMSSYRLRLNFRSLIKFYSPKYLLKTIRPCGSRLPLP